YQNSPQTGEMARLAAFFYEPGFRTGGCLWGGTGVCRGERMNSLDIRVPACRAPRRVPGAAVLAGLAVVFLSVTGARGEAPEDLVEIMRRADAASRRLRAVAYDVETCGIGDLATRVPHVHAKVL